MTIAVALCLTRTLSWTAPYRWHPAGTAYGEIASGGRQDASGTSSHSPNRHSAPRTFKVGAIDGEPSTAQDLRSVREAFAGVKATFLLKEVGGRVLVDLDPKRSNTPFSPCSTFKIMNSLVGLDTGVLKGTQDKFKWDGVKRERAEANRDQTLESAFKDSIVWVYQDVARRIGPVRMQKALDAAKYGNCDISGGIDKFWLTSSLEISPKNQLAVVESLHTDTLPFSKRAQATVRELMLQESKVGWEFSGKTGTGILPDKSRLGWFVGSVKSKGKRYVFVACIEGPKGTTGYTARTMTLKALSSLGSD
ncbi:MAG: hypothetical protein K1X67_09020 [Fimbriimonadaceae bacterium]|nr:hypothetical protein [Fimbriimonadaceae bacterium]